MDLEPNWRKCERSWGAFLASQGYAVTPLNEVLRNTLKTDAPLVTVNGLSYRAPDFQTTSAGASEYWEVKYRSHMDVDPLTGENEFWVEYNVFLDYAELSKVSQTKVWVVVYCKNYDKASGQWLRATTNTIRVNGRRKTKIGRDGDVIDAWVWPVSVMQLVSGPEVDFASGLSVAKGPIDPPTEAEQKQIDFDDDVNVNRTELENLCAELGFAQVPQYSVLAVAPDSLKLSILVKLPNFGIRLFLFGDGVWEWIEKSSDLRHFSHSRLLEYGDCPKSVPETFIIDGIGFSSIGESVKRALDDADKSKLGGFNYLQYQIVHSAVEKDTLVTAGAGTGKTETMSERIMYLLSTFRGQSANANHEVSPNFLSPSDIALITFTKEAAKEMRNRISRVLVMRQRLCSRSVHPVTAWLMQVAQMEVSTIHSFAKQILKESGSLVGLSPDFEVSRGTAKFRSDFNKAISPLLHTVYSQDPELPALHEIQKFVERTWQKIENHGIDLIDLGGANSSLASLQWYSNNESLTDANLRVAKLVEKTIAELVKLQRISAKESQSLTTNQLVPTALQAVKKIESGAGRGFTYLFVDEFQDTDPAQIAILIAIKKTFGSRLFVVGDNKQGIYKFRGAQGDALKSLEDELWASAFQSPVKYSLVKNFRSGGALLAQLNPIFMTLGRAKLLDFGSTDFLRSGVFNHPDNSGMRSRYFEDEIARQRLCLEEVVSFKAANSTGTLAILTRENKQAQEMQSYLRRHNQPCLLVVGGGFYQSEAVRQANAFLNAVLDPTNIGLMTQVLETRWSSGFCREFAIQDTVLRSESWLSPVGDLISWRDRLQSQGVGLAPRQALERIQSRLKDLNRASMQMSFLDWFVKCLEVFKPERTISGPEDDYATRLQYAKNLEHLVTQIDQNFINAPVSLLQIRDWLTLKIATDNTVDEPMLDQQDIAGIPVAITVHKSKGLEFDCVLLPYPEKSFKNNEYLPNAQALVSDSLGRGQLLWKWKVGDIAYTNVGGSDNALWTKEHVEIVKEEARLLYVALTRAANTLVIFEKTGQSPPRDSWLTLIDAGRK